jgi:hypothetical protein
MVRSRLVPRYNYPHPNTMPSAIAFSPHTVPLCSISAKSGHKCDPSHPLAILIAIYPFELRRDSSHFLPTHSHIPIPITTQASRFSGCSHGTPRWTDGLCSGNHAASGHTHTTPSVGLHTPSPCHPRRRVLAVCLPPHTRASCAKCSQFHFFFQLDSAVVVFYFYKRTNRLYSTENRIKNKVHGVPRRSAQ